MQCLHKSTMNICGIAKVLNFSHQMNKQPYLVEGKSFTVQIEKCRSNFQQKITK